MKNAGFIDTAIRIVLAAAVLAMYLAGAISGIPARVLGVVSAALIITGTVGWCGVYALLGISTRGGKT